MSKNDFDKDINPEKREIVKTPGSMLITANPGTGKTRVLAYKFIHLLYGGMKPEEILCLTFTNKAKNELEERIIELMIQEKFAPDLSKLNVHTFHSFALEYLEEEEIVSTNLLRYEIYKFLKENEVLNYGDSYLLETIVPKMENLLRYLKSFGILPKDIKLDEVSRYLEPDERFDKEDLKRFAKYFIGIFEHYEKAKAKKGIDYSDMLIKFLTLKNPPKFKYVLVDELQDVNNLEADIALSAGENFVAVGDKKQAIFGFQGGSIINFKKFSNAKQFVLSENFRSANEVLDYARFFFSERTKDASHKKDLKDLKNKNNTKGEKTKVYDVEREKIYSSICELVKSLGDKKKIAIIARTNGQIMRISKELKNRGIEHSSTYFSASGDAKDNVIQFLKGVLSSDIQIIKNAMFTPFFPCSIQDAFDFDIKSIKTVGDVYKFCPEFKQMRDKVKTMQEVNLLFEERILPVSINYGKEWLLASSSVQRACQEAVKILGEAILKNLVDYIEASELLADDVDVEKKIVVTSVHKAKGKEYDCVIYVPTKTRDSSNFQDKIVEAILKSKGIDAKEELEEESLRIDFVAFTRAKYELHIVTDKAEDYLNDFAEKSEIKVDEIESFDFSERAKRAYSLFCNGHYEKAKEMMKVNKKWLVDYIADYFGSLKHISYSGLETRAYDYLVDKIIEMRESSPAMDLGSEIHNIADIVCKGGKCEVKTEHEEYKKNIEKLLAEIRKKYPEFEDSECKVEIPLKDLVKTDEKINFFGKIDAIFKNNGEYIIIDWKTDRDNGNASNHRQQLEAYRRAFAIKKGIPLEEIKVAIGFIGLKKVISDGKINCELDENQPRSSSFETFNKKVNVILGWRKNVDKFFQDFIEEKVDSPLWRVVVEQYKLESR